MTENLERHQEKLEEKQAACLEQIQEMEKQVGVEGCEPLTMPTAELAWLQGAKGPGSGELPVRRWEERDWPLSWRGGGSGLWFPGGHEASLQISSLGWQTLP